MALPLRSTPVAIGLFDAATGRSEMIAGLTNCVGVLVNTIQVFYEDALNENGLRASVLFTIERGTFAQDVILTAQLDPASYTLSQDTTRIQIWSAYYNAPELDRIRRPLRVEKSQGVRILPRDTISRKLSGSGFTRRLRLPARLVWPSRFRAPASLNRLTESTPPV